jgi:competence protein ComEC
LASFIHVPLAAVLLQINQFILLVLLQVIAFLASFPLASLYVSTPTAMEVVLFYSLLLGALHLKTSGKTPYLFIGLCLVVLVDLAYWNLKDLFSKELTLTFLDVGHGDAILVEMPGGRRMLIDGGGTYEDRFDIGKKVIAPFLWKKKITKIDYLVLTHPDPDHLNGLNFIASQFSPGQFWSTGLAVGSEAYFRLDETLNRAKVERFILSDKSLPLTVGGVEVSFLNPPEMAVLHGMSPGRNLTNNSSLVLRLQFKNTCFLLASDIGQEMEYRMIREGYPLKADLLKIPHHGSASSSAPAFLDRVKPAYGILSVGERTIGRLPNPEVMKRYRQIGADVYRTDRHGAITASTDGEKIKIRTWIREDPSHR